MKQKKYSASIAKRLQKYIGLSFQLAKQLNSSVLSMQERQQAALLGIAHALESYQHEKSSESSWVYLKGLYAVEDAIRQEVIRRKKAQKTKWESLFELQFKESERKFEDDDDDDNNAERIKQFRRLELIQPAIKSLDSRVAKIVKRIALKGEKQRKVAKSLGISQSWCSRLYNRGLDQIREYIVTHE